MIHKSAIEALYIAWCEAESNAHRIFAKVNDDYDHPHFVEADKHAQGLLLELLALSPSLYGALVKLQIACQYEDYLKDAADPACTFIAPHAVVSAMRDLEKLTEA